MDRDVVGNGVGWQERTTAPREPHVIAFAEHVEEFDALTIAVIDDRETNAVESPLGLSILSQGRSASAAAKATARYANRSRNSAGCFIVPLRSPSPYRMRTLPLVSAHETTFRQFRRDARTGSLKPCISCPVDALGGSSRESWSGSRRWGAAESAAR